MEQGGALTANGRAARATAAYNWMYEWLGLPNRPHTTETAATATNEVN
jgi:hypothetical protein